MLHRGMCRLGLTAAIGVSATAAGAHVNWFVEDRGAAAAAYAISDPVFLIWTAIGVGLVMASVWLDGRLPAPRIAGTKVRHDFMEILRVFTGMSFLLTAYEGALLAPHLSAEGGLGLALLGLQALIGILLIANRWIMAAAIMMLGLHVGVSLKFGASAALEYALFVGIALFLIFNAIPDPERREAAKRYSVDTLRISAGISLVALAIGEKLAPSALGIAFVGDYGWNFMQALGIGFYDDRLLVLSAGIVEAAIGVMLILGTTTRLAVFALSAMMALSNVVFILQGNNEAALVEFIGHMPIIGTALLLLLLGYGQSLRVTDMFRREAGPAPAE